MESEDLTFVKSAASSGQAAPDDDAGTGLRGTSGWRKGAFCFLFKQTAIDFKALRVIFLSYPRLLLEFWALFKC